jgi:hypothetical protein
MVITERTRTHVDPTHDRHPPKHKSRSSHVRTRTDARAHAVGRTDGRTCSRGDLARGVIGHRPVFSVSQQSP